MFAEERNLFKMNEFEMTFCQNFSEVMMSRRMLRNDEVDVEWWEGLVGQDLVIYGPVSAAAWVTTEDD